MSIKVDEENRNFKCLVANDDQCQLFMQETILKVCKFDVKKA